MRGKDPATMLLVLIIALCTMGTFTVPPAYAAPEPVVKIDPATISWSEPTNAINDTFTVDVVAENVTDLKGWAVGLSWDPTVLTCTAAGYYDDFRNAVEASPGESTVRVSGMIGVGSFTAPWGESSTGPKVSGTFKLIWATFKAIDYSLTASVINFTVDTELRWDGTITFTTEPGYFTFTPILVYEYDVIVDNQTYRIAITTNSTISDFNFDETYAVGSWRGETSFNVTGPDGTTGFCNVTIPKNLTTGEPWLILIDGVETSFDESENATHTMLYFTYTHSTHKIQIYGTWIVLLGFPTTLFVHPPASTVVIGETFKIGIIVTDVIDLYSFEFKLGYNTTILDAIEVWVMWPDFYIINETAGIVWVSASLPYPYPFSGSGPLAAITFTATELGSGVLDLHDTKLVDFYATPIYHNVVDGYATVTTHDVAIVSVTSLATEVYPTWTVPLDISVVVVNEGALNETFYVTVYYNKTATEWMLIGNQTVTNLAGGENRTLTFSWNVTGLPVGTYMTNATASVLPGETDTADNTLTSTVKIKVPGDADGDGHVTIVDLTILALSWYKTPIDPRADFNGDGEVTVTDLTILALNWYKI